MSETSLPSGIGLWFVLGGPCNVSLSLLFPERCVGMVGMRWKFHRPLCVLIQF